MPASSTVLSRLTPSAADTFGKNRSGSDEGGCGETGDSARSRTNFALSPRTSSQGLPSAAERLFSGVGGSGRPMPLAAALVRGRFAGGDPAGGVDSPKHTAEGGTGTLQPVTSEPGEAPTGDAAAQSLVEGGGCEDATGLLFPRRLLFLPPLPTGCCEGFVASPSPFVDGRNQKLI